MFFVYREKNGIGIEADTDGDSDVVGFDSARQYPNNTGSEIRVRNLAIHFIIKY